MSPIKLLYVNVTNLILPNKMNNIYRQRLRSGPIRDCNLHIAIAFDSHIMMTSNLVYSRCLGIFLVLTVVVGGAAAAGYSPPPRGFQPTPWKQAYATFYGDETASATMGQYI